jgi:hypothetical protein
MMKGTGRREREGGRIVSDGWYVPLNKNYGDATVCFAALCLFEIACFRDIACSHFKVAVEFSIFCCMC